MSQLTDEDAALWLTFGRSRWSVLRRPARDPAVNDPLGRIEMSDHKDESEIVRIIVAAIECHDRGNPEALAKQIVSELQRVGRFIVPHEPTDRMNAAVARSRDQGHWGLDSAWRAMVDAAE